MWRLVKPAMSCWIAHISYPVSQYEWIFHHESTSIYQKKSNCLTFVTTSQQNLCCTDRILEITEHLIQVRQCMVSSLWLCVTWCRGLRNAEQRPNATCQVNPSNGSQAHPTISSPCLWTFCRWLASGENKNQWKHNCLRLKTTTHLHIYRIFVSLPSHTPRLLQSSFTATESERGRADSCALAPLLWAFC